ncbi:C-reactive protein-like [Sphaeramia orbicularis]|uniref:Pentraxin family member n=1 Tax=Sphaeramia orbicularis TaxID=375764 RepID=A0A673BJY2_9TELE|nr:C-reactive protein-like [Sphaeramia orbicularis]
MKFLILLLVTACAASPQDLSGKMFIFPQQSTRAYVKLNTTVDSFSAATVCHRSFTDLKRDHGLFSLATSNSFNDFLIFYDYTNREMEPHVRHGKSEYGGLDYKPNVWHSICTTWDSQSGLIQLWFNGLPLTKKYVSSGSNISGRPIIILGQEQDAHGGKFDINQCFVGMMADVHMWDYVLSACEIQKYVNELNFTPGNVLNWGALDFQIMDRVLIESKQMMCV